MPEENQTFESQEESQTEQNDEVFFFEEEEKKDNSYEELNQKFSENLKENEKRAWRFKTKS